MLYFLLRRRAKESLTLLRFLSRSLCSLLQNENAENTMKPIALYHSERVPAHAGSTRNLIFYVYRDFSVVASQLLRNDNHSTTENIEASCHSDGAKRRGISPRRRAK